MPSASVEVPASDISASEPIEKMVATTGSKFTGTMSLAERDPEMADLVAKERERQTKCIVSDWLSGLCFHVFYV